MMPLGEAITMAMFEGSVGAMGGEEGRASLGGPICILVSCLAAESPALRKARLAENVILGTTSGHE
jgi:hypothetical protein